MENDENLVYYSTNTYLSFWLCKRFYKNYFVWCSPVFNPKTLAEYNEYSKIPPSSSPFNIYNTLHTDVSSGDLHSDKIKGNKSGLMKGASIQLSNGIITEQDYLRIVKIIESALLKDFRPLVYVIPRSKVDAKIVSVDVEDSANPLSIEYQIHDLKSSEFDVIELRDGVL